ncbi:hypothetical protein KFZ58_03995 [Virgibacillus sp. NKC19-16]|uniref:hypothetical protein n=1 Tax=Virgibacillus salidurans TaxID=2831673 RepID=UPI001F30AEDC|nr:hypothetical protein [Virgibacillus sp. NKC19-16]UJL47103.1 hypothetical protein KFZ58_03995 [Virgibacillus sp. NKC19-16]
MFEVVGWYQLSKRINNKTREYLQAGIMVLILILSVFILDLPKTGFFISLGVVIPFSIFLNEVFPYKDKDRKRSQRKREYITSIVLFIVFSVIIFILIYRIKFMLL